MNRTTASDGNARPLPGELKRGTKAYDLLAATPLVLMYALSALGQIGLIGKELHNIDFAHANFGAAVTVVSQLAVLAFATLIVSLLVLRTPPKNSAHGLVPRIIATLGTCLLLVLLLLKRRSLSNEWLVFSTALIVAGTSFATYALAFLGRSISVMAEARRLVTGGPYSIIRHPLYLGEEVAAVGVAIQFFSGWALLLLAVHLGCQVYRMRREEGVLEETFPEYRSYMAETYRVIPGVY